MKLHYISTILILTLHLDIDILRCIFSGRILCILKKEIAEKSMLYLLPGNEKNTQMTKVKELNSY